MKLSASFFTPFFLFLLIAFALGITFYEAKDLTIDAWTYHYYSGSQLFENRLRQDYFAGSAQGYFNPLVHAPFSYMVSADWSDRIIAAVLALYCTLTFVVLLVFYQQILGLSRWDLLLVMTLSLLSGVVWTGIGTSTSDMFIQFSVILASLFFFKGRQTKSIKWLILSGFFWGLAVGLKLSAIIFAPAVLVLLVYWVWKKFLPWQVLPLISLSVFVGFLLVYGWWGMQLFEQFGNPFFPHFNHWFLSPDYTLQAFKDRRFISWNFLHQLLLPFRIAEASPFTYLEIVAPDLKPAIFLVLLFVSALCFLSRKKNNLSVIESEFVIFLLVSLYVWVCISGNGRYAISLFMLMGGAVFILIRSVIIKNATSDKSYFYGAFLFILMLQFVVILSVGNFRFSSEPWGGTWFDSEFEHRFEDELVLVSLNNPLSVIVRSSGENTAFVAPNTGYYFDLNNSLEQKFSEYEGKLLGVFPLLDAINTSNIFDSNNESIIDGLVFKMLGRFAVKYNKDKGCFVMGGKDRDGEINMELLVCHLQRDLSVRERYLKEISSALSYLSSVERRCPELLVPTDNAVKILENGVFEKYYRGTEVEIFYTKKIVRAKKYWSLVYFELGNEKSFSDLSDDEWREKYCLPVIQSGLFREKK